MQSVSEPGRAEEKCPLPRACPWPGARQHARRRTTCTATQIARPSGPFPCRRTPFFILVLLRRQLSATGSNRRREEEEQQQVVAAAAAGECGRLCRRRR